MASLPLQLKSTLTVLNPGHVPVSDEKRNIFDASSIMRVILQIKVLLPEKSYADPVYV